MKQINFDKLRERNDYQIDKYLGGINMEFIKHGDNWLIKNSNGRIVSDEEKLKLEKQELVIQDIESNQCQGETTKKITKMNKKIKAKETKPKKVVKEETEVADAIKETNTTL